jgi:hypothetical protein
LWDSEGNSSQILENSSVLEDEMDGICSRHRRNEKYIILVGRPEGKRPLGRPTRDDRIILKWI